jgi:hypothetical protein
MLSRLLIPFAVIGGALLWFGIRDVRLGRKAEAEPQTISCKALSERGPGANAHVRMTDFVLLTDWFVVRGSESSVMPGTQFWTESWVPAIPADHAFVASAAAAAEEGRELALPTDFRVIVELGAGSDLTLEREASVPVIQGVVMNEIDSVDDDVAAILRSKYPGAAVDRCWILDAGRSPPAVGDAIPKIAGGLVLWAACGFTFVAVRRAARRREEREAAREQKRRTRRRR